MTGVPTLVRSLSTPGFSYYFVVLGNLIYFDQSSASGSSAVYGYKAEDDGTLTALPGSPYTVVDSAYPVGVVTVPAQ